jgi:diguanylate cyclase (GGDEF)-like protein
MADDQVIRRPSRPDLLIWLLSGGLAVMAFALWRRDPQLPEVEQLWWPFLAIVFALTERFAVHLPVGRDNHSLTFSQAPVVLGLFFLSTTELLLATSGAALVWLLAYRHPPIKLAFNVASLLAQVLVSITVFLGAVEAFDLAVADLRPGVWAAALLAALAGDLLSNLALFAILGLRQDRWDLIRLGRTLAAAAAGTIVVTDLALVAALVGAGEPAAIGLLLVAMTLTFLIYRGYHVQRMRYGRLDQLYTFTRSVDRALRSDSVTEAICQEARELMRAGHAAVITCPGPEKRAEWEASAWFAAACRGDLVLLPRGGTGPVYDALRAEGHQDALAAPLREGGDIVALLIVADRLDEISTFDLEDARLFEALAGHAAVAFSNSTLVEQVRAAARETEHLALHDPLTGLPNRLHFQQRLERRLATTGSAAVLLMDIDRFKEVNDTLGHDVGDRLLQEVSERLRELEGEETVVARLGGDEFAVLLGGDDVHVEGMVARVQRDIARPVQIGAVTLDVSASIGISATPADGSSAALLLRHAEVAMYDAKASRTGVARYSLDRDPYSSRRLSLIGDLARALEDGSLSVHYQPQSDPATGQVQGVEALLRWNHVVWGPVPPDEFVPLAEHTGLIRQLTRYVLETAVKQCVAWRDAGTPVVMSVNISARNLMEPELADWVARLLLQAGMPAALLKLEITESAIVAESERAVQALDRLVELGLAISVDDFGTGYSSLARLRTLPVSEVKIDRSFVGGLGSRPGDLAIVRAVITLARELELTVVAEGVEDQHSMDVLAELRCDLVQGYYLARPMPAEDATRWLRTRLAQFATPLRTERAADEVGDNERRTHGIARGADGGTEPRDWLLGG